MRDNAQREMLGRGGSSRFQAGHLPQHSIAHSTVAQAAVQVAALNAAQGSPAAANGRGVSAQAVSSSGSHAPVSSGTGAHGAGNGAGVSQRLPFSIDAVRRCLRHGDHARAEKLLDKILLSQLSELLQELTPTEVRGLCELLFAPARMVRTLDELSRPDVGRLLTHLEDTRLVELLGQLSGAHVARVMALLPHDRRTSIRRRLQANADAFARQMRPVSSVMKTGVPSFGPEQTVAEVRASLEAEHEQEQLYVLDAAQQLLGTISRGRLKEVSPETRLGTLLEPRAGFIARAFTPLHVALKQMRKKAVKALPVLDSQGRLLGELRAAGTATEDGSSTDSHESLKEAAGWRRLFHWLAVATVVVGATQLASVLL